MSRATRKPEPPRAIITDSRNQVLLFDRPEWQPEEHVATVPKDTDDSGVEQLADRLLLRYADKIARVIDRIEEIGLPAPGQQLRLITRRTFNAVALLRYIAERDPIEDLRLVVYSVNRAAAAIIVSLIESGRIRRAEVLISNLRNTAAEEKEECVREMFARRPEITLFYCSSHAKVMSCRTASGACYTVEGSANLSFNSRVENYVIDNDPALFAFTADWMAELRRYLAGSRELEVVPTASPS